MIIAFVPSNRHFPGMGVGGRWVPTVFMDVKRWSRQLSQRKSLHPHFLKHPGHKSTNRRAACSLFSLIQLAGNLLQMAIQMLSPTIVHFPGLLLYSFSENDRRRLWRNVFFFGRAKAFRFLFFIESSGKPHSHAIKHKRFRKPTLVICGTKKVSVVLREKKKVGGEEERDDGFLWAGVGLNFGPSRAATHLFYYKGSGLYRWLTRLALGNSACEKKNPEPNMIMSLLLLRGTSSLNSRVRLITQKTHFCVGGPDGLSFPPRINAIFY